MKLLKVVISFIALVSFQLAAAQWLHVPPPVEARGLMMVGGGVPVAAPAGGYIKVGSYSGDGNATKAITSVGFQPSVVFVRSAGANSLYCRTSSMPATESYAITSSAAAVTDAIRVLDADGFTVGNGTGANTNGTVYHYLALVHSGNLNLAVGSYVGNTDGQTISAPNWQPKVVIVRGQSGNSPVLFTSTMTADTGLYLDGTTAIVSAGVTITSTGFSVGNNGHLSSSGESYYWIALAGDATYAGTFTGDGNDSRNITTPNFEPQAALQHGDNNRFNYRWNVTGDNSWQQEAALAANIIQSFISTGIQVGSDNYANYLNDVYHYVCID